jgi:hypothetical protein
LSVGEKLRYIQDAKDSAKAIWGAEAAAELSSHIEQTMEAAYVVLNYPLDPDVEPATKMRPEGQ